MAARELDVVDGVLRVHSLSQLRTLWRNVRVGRTSGYLVTAASPELKDLASCVLHSINGHSVLSLQTRHIGELYRRIESMSDADNTYANTRPLRKWAPGRCLRFGVKPQAAHEASAPHQLFVGVDMETAADVVDAAVTAGVDLNAFASGRSGGVWMVRPPIIAAAGLGNLAVVARMLELGAEVNAMGFVLEAGDAPKYTTTPLMEACFHGHFDVVVHLLHAGADVDTCCSDGFTPAMQAAWANSPRWAFPTYFEDAGHWSNIQVYTDIAALLIMEGAEERVSCSVGEALFENQIIGRCDPDGLLLNRVCLETLASRNRPYFHESVPAHCRLFGQLSGDHMHPAPLRPNFELDDFLFHPPMFRERCRVVAHLLAHPRPPNPFLQLPMALVRIVLQFALSSDMRSLVWPMVSERAWRATRRQQPCLH